MEEIYKLFLSHPHISTDSRHIIPDSIFFALRGANFDGNRFAQQALNDGAAYAVVDNQTLVGQGFIVVDDVLKTLQDLARHHRRMLGIPILAITGTNGKTTTKELVSRVLSKKYNVYATQGNLNNHIGVPLTLLSMDAHTEMGIIEMGASAVGEISALCDIAEPNFGIITNIGRAHLEGFGGEDGVRRGKGELYDYLAATEGQAFVLQEDSTLVDMARERHVDTIPYSITLADGIVHHLEGDYNRANVAAAAAVGRRFGVSDTDYREAIAAYIPDNNRSQRIDTQRNTLILDCYNANPSSMEAAIANFAREPLHGRTAKVLILGDMLELGAWSATEHDRILTIAKGILDVRVITVGSHFSNGSNNFPDVKSLQPILSEISNAIVLIKGSRGIGLERVVEQL